MNATNISISSIKKTLAGSSKLLYGDQLESSLGNKNTDDKCFLGNENVGELRKIHNNFAC